MLYCPPWSAATRFSKHHRAAYLAERGARVLYVEAPLTPLGFRHPKAFATEFRRAMRPPRQVRERLWVRRHFLPIAYHAANRLTSLRAANQLGQRLLGPVITRDMRALGQRRPILIAGLPHAADLPASVPRRALVYHCADDYANARGFPKTLPQLEADLCRQSDLVITTSETLCQTRRQFNPHTYWVPNGVDFEHFSRRAEPAAELHGVARPIVGFVGGLSEWVDLELIASLARQRPAWSFVMVGPFGSAPNPLLASPNVRLLGPRDYAQLPAYLAAMDVALIPFKHNPVTFHADPIKAYEYLAAGVPVVATDLPALRRLADVVRLARDPTEFLEEIEAALAEGRDQHAAERQAEAKRHSWKSRFAEIERLIGVHATCGS